MILVIVVVGVNSKSVVVIRMNTVEKRGWQTLLDLCQQSGSDKQLEELLCFFLTPEERSALSTRVELVRELLEKQKSQREISKDLRVSIAKITRGSNQLKSISKALERYLKQQLI
jgi:TrpR family transcriptional regulator, trp operon repressor